MIRQQNIVSINWKSVVFIILLFTSNIIRAEYIDTKTLTKNGLYNTYPKCEVDTNALCIDYAYGLEKKLILVFRYVPENEKKIDIEYVMKEMMLTLLMYYNPEASNRAGVDNDIIYRNFVANPYSKDDIVIGMTSRYKGVDYSGYYKLSSFEGGYFSYEIGNIEKSPVDMLRDRIRKDKDIFQAQ